MLINEIFYSLQGEGHYTGCPAVFVRMARCNLSCSFCDTAFDSYSELSEEEIVARVKQYPARHVVLTGGEPTLQLSATLLRLLRADGYFIQLETNGTVDLSDEILSLLDWITCSPKGARVRLRRIDEQKTIFTGDSEPVMLPGATDYRLQPCDTGDRQRNALLLQQTIAYIKQHPQWRLSLQTHKLIGIE